MSGASLSQARLDAILPERYRQRRCVLRAEFLAAIEGIPESIANRQIALFTHCDPAYDDGVRKALRLDPPGDDRTKGTSATDDVRESDSLPA